MSGSDTYLDGMLRHLGAAYYDSLHGRATATDVVRALDRVADYLGEQPRFTRHPAGTGHHPAKAHPAGSGPHPGGPPRHHGRWHSRVRDIMTTDVVTVDRITPYKEVAGRLMEHKISGMPVLTLGRHVAGVVTEADLVAARDQRPDGGRADWVARPRPSGGRRQHPGLTAGELMTAPAITVSPDATIPAAARLMNTHRVRRLPVVDGDGKLIGVVSRRDLLRVFLRPDADIPRQVSELLTEIVPAEPAAIKVTVRGGVVTLTEQPGLAGQRDLLALAVRLAWDIDGVVDVVDREQAGQPT